MTFSGLEPGTYEIIVYGWTPVFQTQLTLIYFDDDVLEGDILGGPWPGGLQEGVTHSVHTLTPASGTFSLNFGGGIFSASGFINGVQIRQIDSLPPSPDLDEDGLVGFGDLLILLSNWSDGRACDDSGDGCLGDLNADGVINFADLLILLAAWETAP